MNPVILKIGGSVITEKNSDIPERAKMGDIDRLSHEIAEFKSGSDSSIILVHGAGSFGHPQAMKYKLNLEFNARGAYLTHVSVKKLNSIVLESLNNAGVTSLPVHPLNSCLLDNGKLVHFQLEQIKVMLERGIMPVLHGDVVMDRSKGAAVLSGDRIIPRLALELKASKIGAGSNVDGVLDENGNVIRKITPSSFADMKKHIKGSTSTDVTGGMLGKVSELLELANAGISSRIFNASRKGMVSKFLYGENVGTLIADK
ncbi:MAG: isopentenyl phosphate kinase [Candidatus Methanoperedens sp.]|nr:isopentenyl phosphate kinase [Candidatus Methanoperedens sp.]